MFDKFKNHVRTLNARIAAGAHRSLSFLEVVERELAKWRRSPERKLMIAGKAYYIGEQDILKRKRTIIGKDGQIEEVTNLPNNRTVDNQYAKMVDQKVNYLVGKPLTVDTENEQYAEQIKAILNRRFHRTLKSVTESSLNGGISWLHPYYNERGEFVFKRFEPTEIKPFWLDADHTILDFGVRLYEVDAYDGGIEKTITNVEMYTKEGIYRYELINGTLVPDIEAPLTPYVQVNGKEYNWDRIPLIPFKYNNAEVPLIKRVKSLQDAINTMLSDFQNNLQEDSRNTILIIKNYDGQDLSEFRHNLAAYGAVKVRDDGGVDTLHVEVNASNYEAILRLLKKALIENANGYDAKDDRILGNPNQMNILSMYSDIELDANNMETEYQAALEELFWFVNAHLANTGKGDFSAEEVNIIFNKDMMMSETDVIGNIQSSVGILSTQTLIAQHPWVDDVEIELERLAKEKEEAMTDYDNAFNRVATTDEGDNAGGDVVE